MTAAVEDWLGALAKSDPSFEWVNEVSVEAYPAYLLPQKDEDGERERMQATAALPIKLKGPTRPDAAGVQKLHDWVVDDRTLGGRVGRTNFEWAKNDEDTICIFVVEPRPS